MHVYRLAGSLHHCMSPPTPAHPLAPAPGPPAPPHPSCCVAQDPDVLARAGEHQYPAMTGDLECMHTYTHILNHVEGSPGTASRSGRVHCQIDWHHSAHVHACVRLSLPFYFNQAGMKACTRSRLLPSSGITPRPLVLHTQM